MLLYIMKAAFPGSFDPPTLGHLNIIQRSAAIFDEICVIIAENKLKNYFFNTAERLNLVSTLVKPWNNVSVTLCTGLIVDFLKENDIKLLIRGIRERDFSYEFELSMVNKSLNSEIETVFLTTDPKYAFIRSSRIKEIGSFGGDISSMVSPEVTRAIQEKMKINPLH